MSCCLSLLSGVDLMNFHNIRSEAHAILGGILKYLRVLGMHLYIICMSVSSDTRTMSDNVRQTGRHGAIIIAI